MFQDGSSPSWDTRTEKFSCRQKSQIVLKNKRICPSSCPLSLHKALISCTRAPDLNCHRAALFITRALRPAEIQPAEAVLEMNQSRYGTRAANCWAASGACTRVSLPVETATWREETAFASSESLYCTWKRRGIDIEVLICWVSAIKASSELARMRGDFIMGGVIWILAHDMF